MKVTKVAVLAAVTNGAMNFSQIGKALGVKGNISGSMTKQIRALVPDIEVLLKKKPGDTVPILTDVKGNERFTDGADVAKKPSQKTVATASNLPKVSDKVRALARYKATGNPFDPESNLGIVFMHGSKEFRSLDVILREAANDPKFRANCREQNGGKEMPLGDWRGPKKGGRLERAGWSYSMIRGAHPNNHGVTDWVKAEGETRSNAPDRLVKAVFLAV